MPSKSGEESSRVAPRTKQSKYLRVHNGSSRRSTDNQILYSPMDFRVSKVGEIMYTGDIGEDRLTGSTEDTETDCSETDSLESDTDEDIAQLSGKIFCSFHSLLSYECSSCSSWDIFFSFS